VVIPSVRRGVTHAIEGLWMLVVDLRSSDPAVREPALARSARGAMMYSGSFKKAFIQSLPYLPLTLVAVIARGRDAARRRRLFAIGAAAATYVAVFSYFRWHGGLSFNLRYFLPALPFVAILAAEGLRRVASRCAPSWHALRRADVIVIGALL